MQSFSKIGQLIFLNQFCLSELLFATNYNLLDIFMKIPGVVCGKLQYLCCLKCVGEMAKIGEPSLVCTKIKVRSKNLRYPNFEVASVRTLKKSTIFVLKS